jgi:urease accessory protein
MATFYICRVGLEPDRWLALEAQLNNMADQMSQPGEILWGVSTLPAHGLVVRALSSSGRALPGGLVQFWRIARRELYGQEPVLPRKVY